MKLAARNGRASPYGAGGRNACAPSPLYQDQHFYIAALLDGLLKLFLDVLQRGLRVGGGLVFEMRLPYISDNAVQIVMQDMAEKVALLYLPQLQRPHIKVILSRRMAADDRLPGGFEDQVHLLHPHIGNPVNEDFYIGHQPLEVRMRGQFAEKPVVDLATTQKFHHIVTQMQRLKLCV